MDEAARFQAGEIEVLCLADGVLIFTPEEFPTVPDAQREDALDRAGFDAIRAGIHAYVLKYSDGSLDLVDTGCGGFYGEEAGALAAVLAQLGIETADISRIILTHLHNDHYGGVFDGSAVGFGDVPIFVHEREVAHWTGTNTMSAAFVSACGGRLRQVSDEDDLGRGVMAWGLPGHTPGHMGLRIGAELVLVGDVIHSEALQLPDPSHGPIYDLSPEQAKQSRTTALSEIAERQLVWSGSHMWGPQKFARLRKDGPGYARVAL